MKLSITDLSKNVEISSLKDLHNKTLSEIFTIGYFSSDSTVKKKRKETDEEFEKENSIYENKNKKAKKRNQRIKILSEITQLREFKENSSVRLHEIYKQITEDENLKKKILQSFTCIYAADTNYLRLVEETVEQRRNTFKLKGNGSHQS